MYTVHKQGKKNKYANSIIFQYFPIFTNKTSNAKQSQYLYVLYLLPQKIKELSRSERQRIIKLWDFSPTILLALIITKNGEYLDVCAVRCHEVFIDVGAGPPDIRLRGVHYATNRVSPKRTSVRLKKRIVYTYYIDFFFGEICEILHRNPRKRQ